LLQKRQSVGSLKDGGASSSAQSVQGRKERSSPLHEGIQMCGRVMLSRHVKNAHLGRSRAEALRCKKESEKWGGIHAGNSRNREKFNKNPWGAEQVQPCRTKDKKGSNRPRNNPGKQEGGGVAQDHLYITKKTPSECSNSMVLKSIERPRKEKTWIRQKEKTRGTPLLLGRKHSQAPRSRNSHQHQVAISRRSKKKDLRREEGCAQ